MNELEACSICGKIDRVEKYECVANDDIDTNKITTCIENIGDINAIRGSNFTVVMVSCERCQHEMLYEEWQSRPLEDTAYLSGIDASIAELERLIVAQWANVGKEAAIGALKMLRERKAKE